MTCRRITEDPWLHRKVLNEIMSQLQAEDFEKSAAEIASEALRTAYKTLGVTDPFKADKLAQNREAMLMEDKLRDLVEAAEDRLKAGLKLAATGNLLDLSLADSYNLKETVEGAILQQFRIDDYDEFVADLAAARTILYILDNAGEIVFDKLLIKLLAAMGKEITCVVRKSPMLNDATAEDAEMVTLSGLAEIIDTGTETIGVPLNLCSTEFRERFEKADLII